VINVHFGTAEVTLRPALGGLLDSGARADSYDPGDLVAAVSMVLRASATDPNAFCTALVDKTLYPGGGRT